MPCLRDFFTWRKKKWYYQCFTPFCKNAHFHVFAFAFESLYLLSLYCAFVYKAYTHSEQHLPDLAKAESLATVRRCALIVDHNYLFKVCIKYGICIVVCP